MAITIHEIKKDLETRDRKELLDFCIRMAKFKKESKELLGFILFEEENINEYTAKVKQQMDELFEEMNKSNLYFIKKSCRKILRMVNKQIRFSSSKQVEAELLIYYCRCMIFYSIPVNKSLQLANLLATQHKKINTALSVLHPDLQYDLRKQME